MPESESAEIDTGWDILARARDGSREAWEALFRQYSPRLLRVAALLTGSTDAARDCVQETFVRVLHSVVRHRRGSLRAYLSTIAYRLALKENVQLKRRAAAGDIDIATPDPSPLDLVIAEERQRAIVGVIRGLPSHHREILVLRLHGGHTYEEIARITGLPLGTVKSRIFHAVKSARSDMRRRGVI